jgi:hypothetical protein
VQQGGAQTPSMSHGGYRGDADSLHSYGFAGREPSDADELEDSAWDEEIAMLEYFGCRLCLSRSWRSTLLSRSIALRRQHLFILRVPTPGVRSDGKRKTAPVHARVRRDGKLYLPLCTHGFYVMASLHLPLCTHGFDVMASLHLPLCTHGFDAMASYICPCARTGSM